MSSNKCSRKHKWCRLLNKMRSFWHFCAIGVSLGFVLLLLLIRTPFFPQLIGDLILMVPLPLVLGGLLLVWLPAFLFWSFRKSAAFLLLSMLLIAYIQGFTLSFPNYAPGDAITIRVIGSNRGQNNSNPIKPFVDQMRADIIALQEAGEWQLADGELDEEAWHMRKDSGYVVLSRFPISEAGLLSVASSEGFSSGVYGYRAVVDLDDGRKVAVYTVHLPTFRPLIDLVRPYNLWNELKSGHVPMSEFWSEMRGLGEARRFMVSALMDELSREPLPVILAGDLNSAPGGFPQRSLAKDLTDTFAEQGIGFGWTFPGKSSHLWTGYGPILRIDYIFVSEHFGVHGVEVEPDSGAQHRAVMAELTLMP